MELTTRPACELSARDGESFSRMDIYDLIYEWRGENSIARLPGMNRRLFVRRPIATHATAGFWVCVQRLNIKLKNEKCIARVSSVWVSERVFRVSTLRVLVSSNSLCEFPLYLCPSPSFRALPIQLRFSCSKKHMKNGKNPSAPTKSQATGKRAPGQCLAGSASRTGRAHAHRMCV